MTSISNHSIHVLLTAILCHLFYFGVNGQELSKGEIEERAHAYFESREYVKAASDYAVLQRMYPKENRYNYYLGRSYLDANMELATAIELLKKTAVRNYGDDTYYHLGRAYHKAYKFNEASHAMHTFQNKSSNKTLKKYDVDHWLIMIENARKSVLVARKLSVEDIQDIPGVSPESAFKNRLNGKYIYAPVEFMTSTAIEHDYKSMMYLSDDIEIGDYLYFSSLSKGQKRGSEIYRVRRITAEDFSVPEVLPEIVNSNYDEAHPFFDKASSNLFFASNGNLSSGGYDIFKSYYDATLQTWSNPEKLDFPINSVQDDYLYTSLGTNDEVIFLSTRSSIGDELQAYTVVIDTLASYEIPSNIEEVITLALLTPSGISVEDDNIHLAQIAPYTAEEPAINGTLSVYDRLINEALSLQMKSDSLDWMSKEMQMRGVSSESYQAKQARIDNAGSLEAESERLQALADEKFRQAELLKSAEQYRASETAALLAENSNSGNGLVHYTYKPNTEATYPEQEERVSTTNLSAAESQGKLAAGTANQAINLGFAISQSSPYSTKNPIPDALLPEGLVYRVQLGAFSKDIPQNTFGGLSPVSREDVGSATKFYVGYFKSVSDARKALDQVKDYGYPDAFIVSYYQNKKITIQEAREIEFAGKQF